MSKYLNKNSPFQGIWDTIVHSEEESLPDETKELIQEYLHPKLEKVWRDLGISKDRIAFLQEDNFWEPAGNTGPCGPCTEQFFWNDNKILEIRN